MNMKELEDKLVEALARVLGQKGSRNGLPVRAFSLTQELDLRLAIEGCLATNSEETEVLHVIVRDEGLLAFSRSLPVSLVIYDARSEVSSVSVVSGLSQPSYTPQYLLECVHDALAEDISTGRIDIRTVNKQLELHL